jgi:TolA-binding protein
MNSHEPEPLTRLMITGALCLLAFSRPSAAADMIAGAAGKKGAFQVQLTHRAPLSTREQIAARFSGRAATLSDYDLTKEPFDVYVPAEPAADGKYGLMIAQNFQDVGKPPTAWTAVLDAHHLIWMGPQHAGDGAGTAKRMGLMLDAVYNAEGTWKIDPNRVYCFISSAEAPASGIPLYFPDVFVGSVSCHLMNWFHNIENGKDKQLAKWQFGKLPRVKSPQLELAQTRRYYVVDRLEENHVGGQDPNADVVNNGFIRDGYKNAKMGAAETHIGNKYMDCAPDWFEAALAYIDVPPETPAVAMTGSPPPAETPAAANAPRNGRGRGGRNAARGGPSGSGAAAGAAAAASAAKQDPPAKADPPPPPPPVADDPASKASKALSLAKSYITAERYDAARERLNQIIQSYPETPAGKEAKTLLEQIKNK